MSVLEEGPCSLSYKKRFQDRTAGLYLFEKWHHQRWFPIQVGEGGTPRYIHGNPVHLYSSMGLAGCGGGLAGLGQLG